MGGGEDAADPRDVWTLPAIAPWEKVHGKHPTQKPLGLLVRIVLASTQRGELVLDPFSGSGTTGLAANLLGRRFVGVEREADYLEMSRARRIDLEFPETMNTALERMPGFTDSKITFRELVRREMQSSYCHTDTKWPPNGT